MRCKACGKEIVGDREGIDIIRLCDACYNILVTCIKEGIPIKDWPKNIKEVFK